MTPRDITWTGDHEDFTARVDGWTLRAERIGQECWFWSCAIGSDALDRYNVGGRVWSEEQAKVKAVGAMNEHRSR
jgi:hypothetical protein